jgi:signal transduction histidine kinase
LGLALVNGVAEAHGGIAKVESINDVGTTFTLELPMRNLEKKKNQNTSVMSSHDQLLTL